MSKNAVLIEAAKYEREHGGATNRDYDSTVFSTSSFLFFFPFLLLHIFLLHFLRHMIPLRKANSPIAASMLAKPIT